MPLSASTVVSQLTDLITAEERQNMTEGSSIAEETKLIQVDCLDDEGHQKV